MIDRKGIGGRKPNPRKQVYIRDFIMTEHQAHKILNSTLLDMLDGCKDDEARRILLGRTEKFSAEPQARQEPRRTA